MKKLLTIIILLISIAVNAQDWPIDKDTKEINFSLVIPIDSANKLDLFVRANEWFAKTYNEANEVIQMNDKDAGMIVGKGVFKVYYHSMGMTYHAGFVHYTLSIMVKEGRYKYELNDLYHDATGSPYSIGSGGSLINEKAACGNFYLNQKYWKEIKQQAFDKSIALIESLNLFMCKQTITTKENW